MPDREERERLHRELLTAARCAKAEGKKYTAAAAAVVYRHRCREGK